MGIFFRKSERTDRKFLNELETFFYKCRHYRSSLREGYIVLLDDEDNVERFLNGIISEHEMNLQVNRITTEDEARAEITEHTRNKIKTVIINANLIDSQANGDALPFKLSREFPEIPVWIFNCSEASTISQSIRSHSLRIGIFPTNVSPARIAEEIGCPPTKKQLA